MQELNLNTDKLQNKSKTSSVNSFPSSEKLCSQQIEKLINNYKEPEKARKFLMDAGIIDADGNLMPPYQPI
jgi:hypothetical protein